MLDYLVGGAIATAGAAGVLAWGAFDRNSPVFGRVQHRLDDAGPVVALTFDDGPNPRATPEVLDTLGAAGVSATFFVLGRHVDRWPDLVRRMLDEGHVVANHGYHHRKLTFRSRAYVSEDIALGAAAIDRAAATRPRLFRAPHGHRNPWVSSIASGLGHRTVGWTLGVWDTALPGARVIADRVLRRAHAGSIVLLHDGDGYDPIGDRTQTASALPAIIEGLRARGLSFVTIPNDD